MQNFRLPGLGAAIMFCLQGIWIDELLTSEWMKKLVKSLGL